MSASGDVITQLDLTIP